MMNAVENLQSYAAEENQAVVVVPDPEKDPDMINELAGGVARRVTTFHTEGPRRILIRASIQQVADINVVEQTFELELRLYLAWLPTEEEYEEFVADPKNFAPFVPQLDILNHTGDVTITPVMINTNASCRILGDGLIHQKLLIQGSLGEKLELHNFPFDCQDLPFKLEAHQDINALLWVPADKLICTIQPDNFKLPEFSLVRVMAEIVVHDYGRFKLSRLYLRVKVQRLPGAYLKRVATVMGIISVSVLFAFALHPVEGLQDRLAHCTTILLTATAFQFVASSSLPTISYLTLMDKYIMFCFLYIYGVSLAIAFIGRLQASVQTDNLVFWTSIGILVVGHLIFAILSLIAMRTERIKLVMTQAQLDAWDRELEGREKMPMNANTDFEYNGAYYGEDVKAELEEMNLLRGGNWQL